MPRRAKTSLHPLQLLGMVVAILAVGGGGWFLLQRKSASGFAGTDLSVRDYLNNSNALSNNSYIFQGVVGDRLDEGWKSTDGRLFEVKVEEGGETTSLPVLIPAKFNGNNVQRDQRFRFKVTVQAETGVLEVTMLEKS